MSFYFFPLPIDILAFLTLLCLSEATVAEGRVTARLEVINLSMD